MKVMDEDEAVMALNERRAARELDKAPYLVGYIRSLVLPGGSSLPTGTVRPPKGDPPLPFRDSAASDADDVYRQLVDWCGSWMRYLPVLPPEASLLNLSTRMPSVWRPDGGDAGGLPANVTPVGAEILTTLVCKWLRNHHTQFVLLDMGATYFADVSDLISGMRARYPMAPRPPRRALKRPCPECGEYAIVAKIPQDVLDTEVVCDACGHEIPWDTYSEIVEGWLK